MSTRGEFLVAILNNQIDFKIVRDQHWYRIPVTSVDRWLSRRWPPKWIAFYQTKAFEIDAHSIKYYSRVIDIRQAYRWQLFPDQPRDEKSDRHYYQLIVEPIQQLPQPIYSRRWRRIIFIPTTWEKFSNAVEINDLYDGSTIEDRLWEELKRLKIQAERQELVEINKRYYFLDFAVYCAKGKLDIETDGDKWHHNPKYAALDNYRNNDITADGWQVLRFTGNQVRDQMEEYCVPKIVENINNLGGVDEEKNFVRRIDLKKPRSTFQYGLFDK